MDIKLFLNSNENTSIEQALNALELIKGATILAIKEYKETLH